MQDYTEDSTVVKLRSRRENTGFKAKTDTNDPTSAANG